MAIDTNEEDADEDEGMASVDEPSDVEENEQDAGEDAEEKGSADEDMQDDAKTEEEPPHGNGRLKTMTTTRRRRWNHRPYSVTRCNFNTASQQDKFIPWLRFPWLAPARLLLSLCACLRVPVLPDTMWR